jgi:hypothetical protein
LPVERQSRELCRNRVGDAYYAAQGQRLSERRRRERPLTRKMDEPATNLAVREGLAQNWAPEQIAGRMKQQADNSRRRVSPQTIYAWIKQDPRREHSRVVAAVSAASVPAGGKTGPPPAMRPALPIAPKSSTSGCDWATSRGTPCWGRQARVAWRRSVDRKKAADHCHQGSIQKRRPRV